MARIAVAERSAAVPASPAKVMRRAFWGVAPLMTPMLILLCWEFATRAGYFSAFMLPSPDAVVARLAADVMSGDFLQNAIATLYRTFVGFAIAAITGVTLGLLMMRNAWVRWFFDPLVSIGLPMPKIAFLPVFILWFGLFDASKITIIAVTAVFPIITATIAGLQGVDAGVDLVSTQFRCHGLACRRRDHDPGGHAADHHRAASRIADGADRRDRRRNDDGG
jgi:ABC-type nitrate/sulfonate/bicarbonate transport system permease component